MLQAAVDKIKAAIEEGRTDIMRTLIDAAKRSDTNEDQSNKFSIHSVLSTNVTPEGTFLHLATKLNQCDIARLLLTAGADPGIHNEQSETSIDLIASDAMQAVYIEELLKCTAEGNVGRVCQLLASGIDVNSVDSLESRNTPLHWASTFGSCDMVRCLLDRKANVHAINADGCTPLHDAVSKDKIDIVEKLIKNGANPLFSSLNGKYANKTAIDFAFDKPHILGILQKHVNHRTTESILLPESGMDALDETFGPHESTSDLFDEDVHLQIETSLVNGILEDEMSAKSSILSDNSSFTKNNIDDRLHLLWPQPQQIHCLEGQPFIIPSHLKIFIKFHDNSNVLHDLIKCWQRHINKLSKYGITHSFEMVSDEKIDQSSVVCSVNEYVFAKENSYQIRVTPDRIHIMGSSIIGFHYALITYSQLLILCLDKKLIPPIQIDDWPSFKYRAVMLDVTNDTVSPTLDFLFEIAETLAMTKINQLLLYARYSYDESFPVHYSRRELLQFCHMCHEMKIQVLPVVDLANANLDLEYSCFINNFSKYLLCFPDSRFIYFGKNLSKYLLKHVHNQKLLYCLQKINGILHNFIPILSCTLDDISSEAVALLPNGFFIRENDHDFQVASNDTKFFHTMIKNGKSFGILSEINVHKSISTCLELCLYNHHRAVRTLSENYSALAVIVAKSVRNQISLTSSVFTLPSYFLSAGFGWNCNLSWDCFQSKMSDYLEAHLFNNQSHSFGKLVMSITRTETVLLHSSLGEEYRADLPDYRPASTPLYQLLSFPDDLNLEHLSVDLFQKCIKNVKQIQNELALIKQQEMPPNKEDLDEIQLISDLILFASRLGKALVTVGQNPSAFMGFSVVNVGIANLPVTTRTDFANKLLSLIDDYKQIIPRKYLQSNVEKMLKTLDNLTAQLIPAGI